MKITRKPLNSHSAVVLSVSLVVLLMSSALLLSSSVATANYPVEDTGLPSSTEKDSDSSSAMSLRPNLKRRATSSWICL